MKTIALFILAFIFSFSIYSQEKTELKRSSISNNDTSLKLKENSKFKRRELKNNNEDSLINSTQKKHTEGSRSDYRSRNTAEDNSTSRKKRVVNDSIRLKKRKRK